MPNCNKHIGHLRLMKVWKTRAFLAYLVLVLMVLVPALLEATGVHTKSLEIDFSHDLSKVRMLRGIRNLYHGQGKRISKKGGAVREGVAGGLFLAVFLPMVYCAYRGCLSLYGKPSSAPRATQQLRINLEAACDAARESIRNESLADEGLPPTSSICTRLPVNGKYYTTGCRDGLCSDYLRLHFEEVPGRHDLYEIKGQGQFLEYQSPSRTDIVEGQLSTCTGRAFWVEKRLDHTVLSTGNWNLALNSFEGECRRDNGTSTQYRSFGLGEVHRRLPEYAMISFRIDENHPRPEWCGKISGLFKQMTNWVELEIPHRNSRRFWFSSCYSFAHPLFQAQGMSLFSINNKKDVTTMADFNGMLRQELMHSTVVCLLFVNPDLRNLVRNKRLMTFSIGTNHQAFHEQVDESPGTASKKAASGLYHCEEIEGTLFLVENYASGRDEKQYFNEPAEKTLHCSPQADSDKASDHGGTKEEYPIIQINDRTFDSFSLTADQVNSMISNIQEEDKPLNFLVLTNTTRDHDNLSQATMTMGVDEDSPSQASQKIEKVAREVRQEMNSPHSASTSPNPTGPKKNGLSSIDWWFRKLGTSN